MKRAIILTSLSVMTATLITGCFSRSYDAEGDKPKEDIKTISSTFVDTIVEGLGYRCGAGDLQFTNELGKFTCNEGDIVAFSIGDVVLGTVKASSGLATEVSPYNLSADNDVVVNIAQLIQSCDDDGNITDVIKIDKKKSELFVPSSIAVDSPTFDDEANATKKLNGGLVSNRDAEAHLLQNAPDITPPVVTLKGKTPDEIREGNTYIDPGATAHDTKDGDLIPVTTGKVNTSAVGEYTLTYTATDGAKNVGTADRTVNVVANAAPVVTLIGDAEVNVREGDTYVELGATATDDLDGDVTANISITGSVDENKPGKYTLTYSATDSENKTGSTNRIVIVKEDKAPVVTLKGASSVTIHDIDNSYTDAGATATDDFYDKINDTLVKTDDVVADKVGTYHVTWTATDDASQTGSATRTVNVTDGTPPVVTLKGNASIECNFRESDNYTDEGATATDNTDGVLVPVESGSVDLNVSGEYIIKWTATDAAGNSKSTTRAVKVLSCANVNPITGGCEDKAQCQ